MGRYAVNKFSGFIMVCIALFVIGVVVSVEDLHRKQATSSKTVWRAKKYVSDQSDFTDDCTQISRGVCYKDGGGCDPRGTPPYWYDACEYEQVTVDVNSDVRTGEPSGGPLNIGVSPMIPDAGLPGAKSPVLHVPGECWCRYF